MLLSESQIQETNILDLEDGLESLCVHEICSVLPLNDSTGGPVALNRPLNRACALPPKQSWFTLSHLLYSCLLRNIRRLTRAFSLILAFLEANFGCANVPVILGFDSLGGGDCCIARTREKRKIELHGCQGGSSSRVRQFLLRCYLGEMIKTHQGAANRERERCKMPHFGRKKVLV